MSEISPETTHAGTFDPLRTYAELRTAGVVGDHSYVHIGPAGIEIGWAPIAHLRCLDGKNQGDWRAHLIAFAERAASLGRKAFGYIGFDAADASEGILPDRSLSGCPLVEFIIPADVIAVLSSPEVLLSGSNREIETNPLAGTRPRGRTPDQDEALRRDLRSDHKEIVEHVVSVTTMVSEVETVCERDSLNVRRFMEVACQPRVQHLSSVIRGRLAPGRHVLEALWALFPSITVSGHSKSRALELLRALEAAPRWIYSGACGWVSGQDAARFSLAIRGVFWHGHRSFLHVGAGIMAESSPEGELQETCHKLAAMKDALSCSSWSAHQHGRLAHEE